MTVVPRFHTARDLALPTYGPKVGQVGAALRRPLMPWQRGAADLITTVTEAGDWRYRIILVTVPRQAGKTTLWAPLAAHRCMVRPNVRVWWTAQKRQDARDSWLEAVQLVHDSPLGPQFRQRKSNGSESLTTPNRSTWRVFPPTEDGLHGKTSELVGVDEAWAKTDAEGVALEAGIVPTFTTTGGQLVIWSTAGTAASTWLARLVERGRASLDDPRSTIGHVEYSLPDDVAELVEAGLQPDAAPADREHAIDLVAAWHPAVGYTTDRAAIAAAADSMKAGEFIRAYGNRFTGLSEGVISSVAWASGAATSWPPPAVPVALAVDVSPDRTDAAIMAAWRDEPGGPMRLDVVDARPGASWLLDRVPELLRTWSTKPRVAASPTGPAVDTIADLERAGVEIERITGTDYTAACGWMLGAINDGRLLHRAPANTPKDSPQRALADAVQVTARVWIGDGAFVWSRKTSAGSISPVTAGSLAARWFDHAPAEKAAPLIVSRRPRARQAA